MIYQNRADAGRALAEALQGYGDKDVVVYALPRGGVVLGVEVARSLHAPLDLIVVRKLGHPLNPEMAIGAVAEDGHLLLEETWTDRVPREWLEEEIGAQKLEARRRRENYMGDRAVPVAGKTAILVDDGIATGLTMRLGIRELRHREPARIVVAVPVAPPDSAEVIRGEVDELIVLDESDYFMGAVGCYYEDFQPVEDGEVVRMMRAAASEYESYRHDKGSGLAAAARRGNAVKEVQEEAA